MPDHHASLTGAATVRLERRLPGPIERVWDYLTDPRLRATWLAGGEMEGRVGGRVTLRFRHRDLSQGTEAVPERYRRVAETGHEIHGVVTAWQPPHRLRYTWDDDEEGSEVTFDLAAEGDGVRLTITHRRLDGRATLVSVAGGWHTHVAILDDRLAGREPAPFWGAHAAIEPTYRDAFAGAPERVAPRRAGRLSADADGRPLLRFTRDLEVGVERAWRSITEPQDLDRWYPARLRFEPRVGARVRESFEGDDTPLPEGTVVTCEPPHRLTFDVEADPASSEPSVHHPQRLAFTLTERGEGSRLVFEHVFAAREMVADFAAGWHACLDALEAITSAADDRADGEGRRGAYEAWFEGVGET